MIASADDLDDSKENIQPLKQGRIVSQLKMALKAQTDSAARQELLEQQRYHEIQIRSYEGDDPLEPWYEYVLWVEQSFVNDGRVSRLQMLLEKCLTKFKDDSRYKHDLRYIKLWITYIEQQVHPLELYKSVFGHGIGTKSALFYRSWAYEFERVKDYKTADKVYRLAYENCAEPKEELDAAHQKMTFAVGQAALGYEVQTPEKPLDEQRQVLSKLREGKKGRVVSRVGTAIQNRMPGKVKSAQMENNVQGFTFKIFNEDEEAVTNSYPSSELQCVPSREVLIKENEQKPGPWTNAHRKTRLGVTALPTARVADLQFPIHEDEAGEPNTAHPSNNLMPALKVRKGQVCDWKCPIAVFEEPDPTRRPMYCKDKVYAGNVEFSFEELRANVYRKRYAQLKLEGSKKLESRPTEKEHTGLGVTEQMSIERPSSHKDGSSAGYLETSDNILGHTSAQQSCCTSASDVDLNKPPWSQHHNVKDEFVIPERGSQLEGFFDNANLDQSSFHSQSITVNTREAIKTVSELWKTPKDDWSPASKMSRDVCHTLFSENAEVNSEVNSLPFHIYTDEQSICKPSQIVPQVVEQKSVKGVLKVPPQIVVHPRTKEFAANLVGGAVLDKENVKFTVFDDDDEDENLCSPDQRGVCHTLFSENAEVNSEVNSLPFHIYTDEQSICKPSQIVPQVVEQKSFKGVLKVPPQIVVHPPTKELAANLVGTAVLDKENVKFTVFDDDDEDENLCSPDQPKSPKFDIPFVPSPGMSEEELSKLKGSESKENDVPPGLAAVERMHRIVTDGVLQPSKTVPFLSLEEQKKLENEYDDLGVQHLPDNSEINNETCNTQAFSFPLPSSTPFTIHAREFSDDVQAAPDEDTIDLMNGKQSEEQPKIVHNHGNMCPDLQTQACGSENLSVIMESSREYKSSSSSGSSGMVTRRNTCSVKGSLGIIDELSSRVEEDGREVDVLQSGHRSCHQTTNLVYAKIEMKTEVEVTYRDFVSQCHNRETSGATPMQIQENQSNAGEIKEQSVSENVEDVFCGFPVINKLLNLTIDSDFDPFSDTCLETVLKRQNFPKGFESDYINCESDLPLFKFSSTVSLGTQKFMLCEMIGKGAYAKVIKATNLRNEKVVALKVQKLSCDWEFYIGRQVQARLLDKSMAAAFIYPDAAFIFKNGSVLVLDCLSYGTLLTVCNKVRQKTGHSLNHLIATFWTRELLCIMRHLMKCSIIHGDLKPDNLMLRVLPTLDLQVPSLKLIDFGRSIDMLQFPRGTTFKKVVTTNGFKCIEMESKRPWTYQTDLFGVAGTAHCLMFGNYMKTCKRRSVEEWAIEASYPRYCCREEWRNFFTTLLNIESCDKLPDLLLLETAFQKYLNEQKASLAMAFIQMNNILNNK